MKFSEKMIKVIEDKMNEFDKESSEYSDCKTYLERLKRRIAFLEYKGASSFGSIRGMLQHMYKGETIIFYDDDVLKLVVTLHDYANYHIEYSETKYNEAGFPSVLKIKEKELELQDVIDYIYTVFQSRGNIHITFGANKC